MRPEIMPKIKWVKKRGHALEINDHKKGDGHFSSGSEQEFIVRDIHSIMMD